MFFMAMKAKRPEDSKRGRKPAIREAQSQNTNSVKNVHEQKVKDIF